MLVAFDSKAPHAKTFRARNKGFAQNSFAGSLPRCGFACAFDLPFHSYNIVAIKIERVLSNVKPRLDIGEKFGKLRERFF